MRSLIKFPITILELGGSKDYVRLRYQINLGVGEHLPTKQVELKYSVLIEWDWRARGENILARGHELRRRTERSDLTQSSSISSYNHHSSFPLSALISWGCTREVGLFSEAFVRFFSIKARGGPYGIYLIRRSGMQYRWVLLRVVPFGNKIQTKTVITKQYYTPKILISYFIILLLFSAKWFPSFLIRWESKTDREV